MPKLNSRLFIWLSQRGQQYLYSTTHYSSHQQRETERKKSHYSHYGSLNGLVPSSPILPHTDDETECPSCSVVPVMQHGLGLTLDQGNMWQSITDCTLQPSATAYGVVRSNQWQWETEKSWVNTVCLISSHRDRAGQRQIAWYECNVELPNFSFWTPQHACQVLSDSRHA